MIEKNHKREHPPLRERARRLLPAIALLFISGLAACSPHRQSGGLANGMAVDAYTVDNGSGSAVTVVDVRRRAMNRQTGERDGPWQDSAPAILPGPSNGPAAIQAVAGVVAAGLGAGGAVLAADRFSCGGRGCGSGGGNFVNVETFSGSRSDAAGFGYGNANANVGGGQPRPGYFPHGGS